MNIFKRNDLRPYNLHNLDFDISMYSRVYNAGNFFFFAGNMVSTPLDTWSTVMV